MFHISIIYTHNKNIITTRKENYVVNEFASSPPPPYTNIDKKFSAERPASRRRRRPVVYMQFYMRKWHGGSCITLSYPCVRRRRTRTRIRLMIDLLRKHINLKIRRQQKLFLYVFHSSYICSTIKKKSSPRPPTSRAENSKRFYSPLPCP